LGRRRCLGRRRRRCRGWRTSRRRRGRASRRRVVRISSKGFCDQPPRQPAAPPRTIANINNIRRLSYRNIFTNNGGIRKNNNEDTQKQNNKSQK